MRFGWLLQNQLGRFLSISQLGSLFRREMVCFLLYTLQTPEYHLSVSLIVSSQGCICSLGYSNPGCHIVRPGASVWLSLFQLSFLFQFWLVFSWWLWRSETWFRQYEELAKSGKLACRNSGMCRLVHRPSSQIPWDWKHALWLCPCCWQLLGHLEFSRGQAGAGWRIIARPRPPWPPALPGPGASAPWSPVRVKGQHQL